MPWVAAASSHQRGVTRIAPARRVPLLPCADGSLTAPAGHARLRRAQLRSDRPPGRLEAQGDPKDKGAVAASTRSRALSIARLICVNQAHRPLDKTLR